MSNNYSVGQILKSKVRNNFYVMVCAEYGNGYGPTLKDLDQTRHQFRAIIIHSDSDLEGESVGYIANNWNKGDDVWEASSIKEMAING